MTPAAYPSYRPTRIGWVDEVPSAWGEARLGRLSRIYAGGTPDKTRLDFWRDGTIPWVNSGVVNQAFVTEASALITEEAFSRSSTRWVRSGALVIALAGQGKTKGMVAQMGIDATCNQSMAAVEPGSAVEPRYLYWWIDSNYRNLRSMGGGDLRDGLNLVHIGSIPVPLPPLPEQRQIAHYLDAQTAKIDALIGKQERLIETLAERREAVISHAVTKGLDRCVPMKDSKVEWLGSIPAAWTLGHLRWFARCASGKAIQAEVAQNKRNPYPVLGGNGEMGYSSTPNAAPGSLVVGRVGALCGNVHKVSRASWVTDNALHLTPSSHLNIDYLLHLLRARRLNDIASKTAQPLITGTQVLDQTIAIPPLDEQRAIVAHLDHETSQIDALSAKARQMIDVLKERRQALISAAVTGKIDVRGLV